MAINEKALVKQIKVHANKGRLYWQVSSGFHYITNGIWMAKLPPHMIQGKVLGALVEVVGTVPQDGDSFGINVGRRTPSGPDCTRIWPQESSLLPAEITNVLHMNGSKLIVRLIKTKTDVITRLIGVDTTLLDMVDVDNTKTVQVQSDGRLTVFDDNLIIFPVALRDGSYVELIQAVLA